MNQTGYSSRPACASGSTTCGRPVPRRAGTGGRVPLLLEHIPGGHEAGQQVRGRGLRHEAGAAPHLAGDASPDPQAEQGEPALGRGGDSARSHYARPCPPYPRRACCDRDSGWIVFLGRTAVPQLTEREMLYPKGAEPPQPWLVEAPSCAWTYFYLLGCGFAAACSSTFSGSAQWTLVLDHTAPPRLWRGVQRSRCLLEIEEVANTVWFVKVLNELV